LDTEVVVLIERETLGGGVVDDWASTVATKPNPRKRTAARRRVWRRPTMAMVGGRGSEYLRNATKRSAEKGW
jgi:hypothetical protein